MAISPESVASWLQLLYMPGGERVVKNLVADKSPMNDYLTLQIWIGLQFYLSVHINRLGHLRDEGALDETQIEVFLQAFKIRWHGKI